MNKTATVDMQVVVFTHNFNKNDEEALFTAWKVLFSCNLSSIVNHFCRY